MAATLAFRLKRLEAMRQVADGLVNRNRLGRDIFARGAPEHIPDRQQSDYDANLYDLLSAYAALRQRHAITQVTIERRTVWSLTDARELLTQLIGDIVDWTVLEQYLLRYLASPAERVTAIASAFAASLELAREGKLELRQDGAFQPIYMRRGPNHATLQMVEQEQSD
jgi:segregation and condensation protein A